MVDLYIFFSVLYEDVVSINVVVIGSFNMVLLLLMLLVIVLEIIIGLDLILILILILVIIMIMFIFLVLVRIVDFLSGFVMMECFGVDWFNFDVFLFLCGEFRF